MRMGFVGSSFFMHDGDFKYTKEQLIDAITGKFDLDLSLIQYDNDIIKFIENNIEENSNIDYLATKGEKINVFINLQTQLIISEKECKKISFARKVERNEDGTYTLIVKC